jgi:PII-like signaling protein
VTPSRCATGISWLVVHEARPVKLSGRTLRLSIFVGEGDTWHHRSRYAKIERRADQTGPAEATLIREIGGSFHVNSLHPFRSSSNLPLLIVIIDAEDRVRAFLPRLNELGISGLLTLDKVDVISYGTDPRPRRPSGIQR